MNWPLLQNSLFVAGLTTLFSTLLGFFSALWLAGLETRWRKLVLAFAIIALALPPFLVTNCWLDLLGLTGLWRSWLPLNIFSLGGTIWMLVLMTWPITLFFVLASWRRLDPAQLEVDPMLGGGSLVRLLLVPTARPALTQAALLTFVLALNNFAVPAILQVKVFPAELWVSFNTTFDYKAALLLGWPMMVAPLLLVFLLRGRNNFWSAHKSPFSAGRFRAQLGRGLFHLGGAVFLVAIFFSAILPLAELFRGKGTWANFLPALAAGKAALLHSAGFSTVTGIVVVCFSLFTWRWPLSAFSWLTFLVPGVILGIALIWLFNRPPFIAFYQSAGVVIVSFAIRYFAPGWNLLAHSLRTTDPNLTDAALLEGANRWQVFRHVQLPQIFPQVCVAWYVTYLFCLWDVETLVLIVPPGSETVSLRIFNLLHYGHNSQVNALCVLLLGLAILPLVIWQLFPSRYDRTPA
ncbi:MAG: ABC transporter permease subunit [Verrucomicrobiota bacterium]